MNKIELFLAAISGQPTPRFPIWMMRQAGRYMAAYQHTRKTYSFDQMIRIPEVGAEVTLQPILEFGFDAAILFSDILVTANALGSDITFIDQIGPVCRHPVNSLEDIQAIKDVNAAESFAHIIEEIHLILDQLAPLQTPLIGFAGAPFTVASYMIGHEKGHDIETVTHMMFHQPEAFHLLLNKLATITAEYLSLQIEAGVHAIQIFDSWNNVLSYDNFHTFCLPYLKKVIERIKNPRKVPIICFGLGNTWIYPELINLGVQVIGFPANVNLKQIKQSIPKSIAVQGNLDPYLLLAPQPVLKQKTMQLLTEMKNEQGFIFNLGHGVMKTVPEDNVRLVVDTVQSFQL